MYLDIPAARRSSYSSYRREGGGVVRKIGIALLVVVVVAIGLGAYQWTRALPAQRTERAFPASVTASGSAPRLPWPTEGQAAVAVGGGVVAWPASGAKPAAIASLAKMMTAYQVLTDHPLAANGAGPTVTVTAADVADYRRRAARQQSVLAVRAGERLTEYQLLQAMLIPSANNVAVILARWDAGSVAKFVARMNATAHAMGLNDTRYADPDGSSPRTVSTAVDQLALAQRAMGKPVFAKIVAQPAATFPVSGKVYNYDYLIGHYGVVGIKTGSDAAAGGCWAFAARRSVDGRPSVVYGVVLGQHQKKTGALIQPALELGRRLADAAPGAVQHVTLVPSGTAVGRLHAGWRPDVPLVTQHGVAVLAVPGQKYHVELAITTPHGQHVPAGTVVGRLTVAGVSTPVVVAKDAAGPSPRWRLTRL
jgi:D-alanyl-D-alanine carboxypeptidase (penicillin-binding protein 5/6)